MLGLLVVAFFIESIIILVSGHNPFVNLAQVNGVHPECSFKLEIHKEETRCMELLKNSKPVDYKGKKTVM